MGLSSGGCIIGRIFGSEILGAHFREGAFYRNFTVYIKLPPPCVGEFSAGFACHSRARSRCLVNLHGTGSEPLQAEPDRIGFCLNGTVWNRSMCLHVTVLEPVPGTDPKGSNTQTYKLASPVLDPLGSITDRFQNGPV